MAALPELMPIGTDVPARSVMDGALVYLVHDGASHLELLGPGIALGRLYYLSAVSHQLTANG